MCNCKGYVPFGTYENTEVLLYPFSTPRYPKPFTHKVNIDNCLVKEIKHLWDIGIETDASCCGHNRIAGNIIVPKFCIKMMEKEGYTHDKTHKSYKNRNDIFFSKTCKK